MIRRASEADAEWLTGLTNRAFSIEKFFIDSDRITVAQVEDFLARGTFLIAEDSGCVYVEVTGIENQGKRGYFGLLSVEPARQGAGIGKRLIAAAEDFCREAGCSAIDMRIVNLREELPAFYRKQGYVETGTEPFPADVETKRACHFVNFSKLLLPLPD